MAICINGEHILLIRVERMNDKIYALSNNALFSVNSQTDEIEYYSRLTGLHAATIDHIAYNKALNKLLLTYQNGQLDVIDSNERVHNISDLYLKQANISKKIKRSEIRPFCFIVY